MLEVTLLNPHFINFVIPITSLHARCSATLSVIAIKKNKRTKEVYFQRENWIINGKLFVCTVQPGSPVNLTLETKRSANIMYLWAKWSPPLLADASSNHLYHYELRIKPEEKEEWEVREKYIKCIIAFQWVLPSEFNWYYKNFSFCKDSSVTIMEYHYIKENSVSSL